MIDALQLLALRGVKPIRIERSHEKAALAGFILGVGRFTPAASPPVGSSSAINPQEPSDRAEAASLGKGSAR